MSAALILQGFGVAFGTKTILRSIDLTVPERGCTVLLGPSGAGKSTLLRTLAGLNEGNPALRLRGRVFFMGRPLALNPVLPQGFLDGSQQIFAPTAPRPAAAMPGLVVQKSKLLVSTVFENLVSELQGRATLSQLAQRVRVDALLSRLDQTGLAAKLNTTVTALPLSEQRQVAILRTLMSNPPLLMVDEPTTDLSTTAAQPVLALLERIRDERALLVILHNLQEARRIGHRVALLANRVIEEDAEVEVFYTAPRSPLAQIFVATGSCPEASYSSLEAHQMALNSGFGSLVLTKSEPIAVSGPRGFLWLLPQRLAGAPKPGVIQNVQHDFAALQSVGVTQLVSLTQDTVDIAMAAAFGIQWQSCAMPDMAPPTITQALMLCKAIDKWLTAGEVVTVHCHGGLGRTGTVLAAYTLWQAKGELTAPQALQAVRRVEPRWVQSPSQIEFIGQFARLLSSPVEAAVRLLEVTGSGFTAQSNFVSSTF
jgi:atypical dual specificity phosphatase